MKERINAHIAFTDEHRNNVYKAYGVLLSAGIVDSTVLTEAQVLAHDWSKYLDPELTAYARHFFNSDGSRKTGPNAKGQINYMEDDDLEFERAVLNHKRVNPHHWDYWVYVDFPQGSTTYTLYAVEMPLAYVYEMIADWMAAGKTYGNGTVHTWYANNHERMLLGAETRAIVEKVLAILEDSAFYQKYLTA